MTTRRVQYGSKIGQRLFMISVKHPPPHFLCKCVHAHIQWLTPTNTELFGIAKKQQHDATLHLQGSKWFELTHAHCNTDSIQRCSRVRCRNTMPAVQRLEVTLVKQC